MKAILLLAAVLSLGVASSAQGQERRPVGERPESKVDGAAQPAFATVSGRLSQDNEATVPRLLKFSGVLTDLAGKPLNGEVEVTFALYKQEGDEEPLWTETQRVQADERGGYTALLGATQPTGMPAELFRSDEARWLGVQVQGQAQQPRTLLVSVPYALKAVDAEKLGGKSLADFVLSESLDDQVRRVIEGQTAIANQATPTGALQPGQAKANSTLSPQATTPGPKFPPSMFSGITSDQIVSVQQNGSGNGLYAQTASSTGNSAVVGVATSASTSSNQNGVIGFNAGAGAGVAGIATNSAAGVGVYGQSANFAGVFGNGTSTSYSNGVWGQTASSNGGAGVTGISTATSGYAEGVHGESSTGAGVSGRAPNHTGVYGQTVNWVGVGGQASATSGGPAYGVWGDSSSTDGVGVAGYADATSGSATGVFGQSVSPNGSGVFGVNNAATSGNGVVGVANATSGGANGVFGFGVSPDGAGVFGANNSAGGVGVVGQADGANGFAVWGAYGFGPTPGGGVGVKGSIEAGAANGVAGQFFNVPGQGLILQGIGPAGQVFSVDPHGNLQISGNLIVSGTKSSTAKLQDGREVALYAVESPENWFEDFGSAELSNGVAWVPLEASFAQTVNAAVNYHVFLTPNGDSNGLYVARKTATGFEIREHGGGASNIAFDYRIVARRRGYEAIRMLQVPERKTLETLRPPLKMATGHKVEPPKINLPIAPAIRQVPPPPIAPALSKISVPQPPKPR
jgi:hypothetical protein